MLLRVEPDDERWHVDDLAADAVIRLASLLVVVDSCATIPDVTLPDQDTSVMDGLGKTELVDTGLQAALQEILDLQGQHVIELPTGLVEHTDTDETANERVAFEQTLRVFLIESEKLTERASVESAGAVL